MRAVVALLREAAASGRSQPVASLLTVAMVAGMCVAVLLTTGRTVAAEQAVLSQIDAAGTRSLVVRGDASAGLTTDLLTRLAAVEGIESVTGFGPIVDAHNAAIDNGPKVAVRRGYGTIGDLPLLTVPTPVSASAAWATPTAAEVLGLRDGTGGLVTEPGEPVLVTGSLPLPDHYSFLDPMVVIPASTSDSLAGPSPEAPLTVLVVVADEPAAVAGVEATVRTLLFPERPGDITVETPATLAEVRAAVSGELGQYGRSTVLGILAICALLVAANLFALVTMRRKDFGRRRALGATRSLIMNLLLLQVGLLGAVGGGLGTLGALIGLRVAGHPVPGAAFCLAVAVLGLTTALLAAVAPALLAARRDPLHELRVP